MNINSTEPTKEGLDRLLKAVKMECSINHRGNIDSEDNTLAAEVLLFLAKYSYVKIIREAFGRVEAKPNELS